MTHAEAAAIAIVGSCKVGVDVVVAYCGGEAQLERVGRALLNADGAAVAQCRVDNGLLPLLLGNVLRGLAELVKNTLVFADVAAGSAVDTAIGIDLMLLLHFAADRSYGADLGAIVAALAFIGNFM